MTIWCRKNSSFTADIIRQHHKILSQKGKHLPKVEMYFFLRCKFSCNLWKSLSINHYKDYASDVLSLRKCTQLLAVLYPVNTSLQKCKHLFYLGLVYIYNICTSSEKKWNLFVRSLETGRRASLWQPFLVCFVTIANKFILLTKYVYCVYSAMLKS